MELVALIEENNNQISTYNFSEDLQVEFIDHYRSINIRRILDEPAHFYGKNIINVTAIVGENGVGKTRLLARVINYVNKYVYKTRSIRVSFKEAEAFVLIYRSENTLYYLTKNWINENFENKTTLLLKPHATITQKDISPVIFLSNATEQSPRHVNVPSSSPYYFDISETMMSKELSGEYLRKIKMQKQINFLREFKKSIDGITWPTSIYLETELLTNLDKMLFGKNSSRVKKLLGREKIDDFYEILLKSVGISLNEETGSSFYKKASLIYLKFFLLNREKKDVDILVQYFNDNELTIENIRKSSKIPERKIEEINTVYIKLLEELESIGSDKDLSSIIVDLDHPLVSLYNRLGNTDKIFRSLISAHWEGISAGQYALINIFSTLFDARLRVSNIEEEISSQIIIIIDEVDLYLHPHWQTMFLKILFEILPEIFTDSLLQLIFTTHSPLLLSDLKKSSLLLLNEKGIVNNFDTVNYRSLTFGANINSIMSSEFFLNGGLMGEFAKEKINNVINFLNSPDQKNSTRVYTLDEIKGIIQEVGEPILKAELVRMLDEYLILNSSGDKELESLKSQVSEIINKIQKLERN